MSIGRSDNQRVQQPTSSSSSKCKWYTQRHVDCQWHCQQGSHKAVVSCGKRLAHLSWSDCLCYWSKSWRWSQQQF